MSTRSSWPPPRSCAWQTIVSREVAATQAAVVTVGSLQAGTKDNVIPDEALLKLNVRTFDKGVRQHVRDFGSFGAESGVPSVFWYVGGIDPDTYRKAEQAGRVAEETPTNHSPTFAPVIHPTLEAGVEAMTAAALDALGPE